MQIFLCFSFGKFNFEGVDYIYMVICDVFVIKLFK